MVVATVVPVGFGIFGLVYGVSALVLGAIFAWMAWMLWRELTKPRAAALFHYSLLYLALLFVAMAARLGAGVTEAPLQEAVEMTPGLAWRASFLGLGADRGGAADLRADVRRRAGVPPVRLAAGRHLHHRARARATGSRSR